MKPIVAVSGYCQVAGMFRALSVLLPDHDVRYVALPTNPTDTEIFKEQLAGCSFWACADTFPSLEIYAPNCLGTVVKWPQVVFSGFHPDIVLASNAGTPIEPLGTPYNSAIALQAYVCGASIAQTLSLFEASVFGSLGYFDYFHTSFAQLRKQFDGCQLNFDHYFRSMQQSGVAFMHSYDHSKISSIVEVARQIALRISPAVGEVNDPIEEIIEDALLHNTIWPVYPEIARRFAVTGSYRWKILTHYIPSLPIYLEVVFDHYNSIGLSARSLGCSRFADGLYKSIISERIGPRKISPDNL